MSVELDETQPASQPASSGDGPALPPRISKYEIGARLGAGGNGVVMLARDVTLDRKVAIKLLRGDASEAASQRLLREAQAAAKLVHENVIVVHEVGTHDGSVFVAMEHVAGGTLRDYGRTHTWREVLDVYRRAGHGLAAAHAAGLVHRDFKPDNVLVGDDGRVRVTDFGLVSVSGTRTVDTASLDGTALNSTLTRTGTVMGTPRYMAPEQHEGSTVDERADQFAFCVALYEALFHRAPFEGESYESIATHVCAGEIVPPPSDSPVPRAIRDAVLRGLAPAAADRWPSMTDLLAALTPPAARSRRVWLALVPLVLMAAALVVYVVTRPSHDTPSPAARNSARDEFRLAQAAYAVGDYQSAANGFKRAFELDPDLDGHGADYIFNMGIAYEKLGNCPEAVVAYRRYLAIGRNVPDRDRVEERLRRLGDCKGPIAVDPADAAYKEGEDAYNRGDFAAALAAFKRGFALQQHWDKRSAAYLYNAGQAARQIGYCADAAAAFKQYLSLQENLAPAMRAELEQRIAELERCAAQQGSGGPPGSASP